MAHKYITDAQGNLYRLTECTAIATEAHSTERQDALLLVNADLHDNRLDEVVATVIFGYNFSDIEHTEDIDDGYEWSEKTLDSVLIGGKPLSDGDLSQQIYPCDND